MTGITFGWIGSTIAFGAAVNNKIARADGIGRGTPNHKRTRRGAPWPYFEALAILCSKWRVS